AARRAGYGVCAQRAGPRPRAPAAPVRALLQGRRLPQRRRHGPRARDRAGERAPARRRPGRGEQTGRGQPLHAPPAVAEPLRGGHRAVAREADDGDMEAPKGAGMSATTPTLGKLALAVAMAFAVVASAAAGSGPATTLVSVTNSGAA